MCMLRGRYRSQDEANCADDRIKCHKPETLAEAKPLRPFS